jgi:GDP-4-dehydro-6-deoxy-D-mannose reductase
VICTLSVEFRLKILITGAGGFVGGYLIQQIQNQTPDAKIYGTAMTEQDGKHLKGIMIRYLDLKDHSAVIDLMDDTRPDSVYHLAAQSFVPRSFEDPWETLENNIRSQLNLIEACIELNIKPRMLIIASAEVYGPVSEDELPITEDAPFRPTNPYSVSKVTQDVLAYQYYMSHQLPLIRTRSFNHFGPGQSEQFVAPAFAMQVARIEAGLQEPVIKVGNLNAQRDFTDVRDVVRAYQLLIARGQPGTAYNIASGQARTIRSILEGLIDISGTSVRVETDPTRLRPVEVPINYGSTARLQAHTGWTPQIPFDQSLSDILNDCRQRVRTQQGAN